MALTVKINYIRYLYTMSGKSAQNLVFSLYYMRDKTDEHGHIKAFFYGDLGGKL